MCQTKVTLYQDQKDLADKMGELRAREMPLTQEIQQELLFMALYCPEAIVPIHERMQEYILTRGKKWSAAAQDWV